MDFDEFRILVEPDIQNPSNWSIRVQNCSQDIYKGSHGVLTPAVSIDEISRLRNPTEPPDFAKLRQLGMDVLHSVMPPTVQLGFRACLQDAVNRQRGLRLIIVLESKVPTADGVTALDIPLEAAFLDPLHFIATDIKTPISRGVKPESDRNAQSVNLPVRILLVVSEPTDMPPVKADAERQAIMQALAPLISSGAVVVDLCEPPTLAQLNNKLQERYQVVHFIGHGDYEIVPPDVNPQPHLYFEDGTQHRRRKAADIEQIYTPLRNGNVPLLVLTACSTAASAPNGTNYPVVAFESLAKSLVERQFGPLAAVAMQFDLETQAAEVFSKAFYTKLLSPGWSLDAAVSQARSELIGEFGAGHRSWVNPTVYWRCREGRIFDVADAQGHLTPEQRAELLQIEGLLDEYMFLLEELAKETPEARAATANLQAQWRAKIDALMTRRGLVLGDSIRLRGGKPDANGEIECSLTVRLRLAATVGDVSVTIRHDSAVFTLTGNSSGANVAANSVFLQPNNSDQTNILIRNASSGGVWNPGEYELAKLKFRLSDPALKPIFHIVVFDAVVNKNGASQPFQTLNAVIFGGL